MLTLESMPKDIRLLIVSKIASTSPINYFNTIITCKRLHFGPEYYPVAKALNLKPLVNQPSLANRYRMLVARCLEANNIDAHFVKADTTVCSNCFHFFLLTEFYKMMLGFSDLMD
ncbi:unnamed protein product [Brassica rapa subsp. trilocularis]